ncbi:MAG: RelA/SpoT domain-containing protein [Solirubrobacterales bacterium]
MPSSLSDLSELPSKETVNKAGRKLADWLYDSAVVIPDEEIDLLALHVYAWRAQHYGPLGLVMPMLREWSDRYSTSNIKPSQRLKRFKQIIDKLHRHPDMKLARMQDIGGARAVLANRDEVEELHAKIRDNWGIHRAKDWRDHGRPDTGYRALHLMVAKRDQLSGEDRIVEIQLRTATEHRWSQVIMAAGERLGYSLRDGDGPDDLLEYFRLASDVLAAGDTGEPIGKNLAEEFVASREKVSHYFEEKES